MIFLMPERRSTATGWTPGALPLTGALPPTLPSTLPPTGENLLSGTGRPGSIVSGERASPGSDRARHDPARAGVRRSVPPGWIGSVHP